MQLASKVLLSHSCNAQLIRRILSFGSICWIVGLRGKHADSTQADTRKGTTGKDGGSKAESS